jgi:hypothetical protein
MAKANLQSYIYNPALKDGVRIAAEDRAGLDEGTYLCLETRKD